MSAPVEVCRVRAAMAVLASGVVVSLTALTAGVTPALAAPDNGPATPTTTLVEAPAPEVAESTESARPAPTESSVPESSVPESSVPESSVPEPSVAESTVVEPSSRAPEPAATTEATTPPVQPTTTASAEPTTTAPAEPTAPATAPAEPATTTTAPAPAEATTTTTAPASSAAATPTSPAPTATRQAPVATTSKSPATSAAPRPATAAPSTTPTTTAGTPATTPTTTTEPVAAPAALTIGPERPDTLQAVPADVAKAKNAKPVVRQPDAAPEREIAVLASALRVPGPVDSGRIEDRGAEVVVPARGVWDRRVRQWDRDWISYDKYYRPILSNPYRDPVRIVYTYDNAPRIAVIPPLARIVLEVARLAAYSFTALVLSPVNALVNVAVGTFFGGGFVPAAGLPLPAPLPVLRYDNVPVQVRYPDAVYQPFRVQRIIDVGDDPVYGGRKVLLDGTTPAWGTWSQTPTGERLFEVNKTQQYPGLDEPRQVPLPGDYPLRLVAEDASAAPAVPEHRTAYLVAAALACAGLSVGAVIGSVLLGRRRARH